MDGYGPTSTHSLQKPDLTLLLELLEVFFGTKNGFEVKQFPPGHFIVCLHFMFAFCPCAFSSGSGKSSSYQFPNLPPSSIWRRQLFLEYHANQPTK